MEVAMLIAPVLVPSIRRLCSARVPAGVWLTAMAAAIAYTVHAVHSIPEAREMDSYFVPVDGTGDAIEPGAAKASTGPVFEAPFGMIRP